MAIRNKNHHDTITDIAIKLDQMLDAIPKLGTDNVGKSLDAFIEARFMKDRIDNLAKKASAVVQEFADHHIPQVLERHGLDAAPHKLGMISMNTRYSTTVLDRPGAHAWLVKNGMSNLIIETTNAMTLSAVAKTMIEKDGTDFPPDYFKTTIRNFAKFTPAGGK